jgi:two-component system sensor histidine kinase KdpD
VYVDHALVEQILANLLENADRHGPPGTVITVEAKLSTAEGVTVSVTDRGPGVPRGERDTIFDTFVRFDTGGRAGLGLAIAKAFVEAHGGHIWVEEASGGGARFVFTLPLASTNGSKH